MAYDPLAMADLVSDALDLSSAEVTDLVQAVPLVNMLGMVPSSNGETHKYSKETGAPVVGFRAPNVGRDEDSSVDTIVTVTLKHLDFSYSIDKAVADIWRQGGAPALNRREGLRHLKAAMVAFEKQLIYGTGTGGDSSGFTGMFQSTTIDGTADTMVVDVTGTTATTGSSVLALAIGPNDVQGVYNGDQPFMLGDTVTQRLTSSGSLTYPAYYTPAGTWLGVQVGSIYSMGRIMNITEDSNKKLTDVFISTLLSKFPITHKPTALFMSRRSLKQLQQSRTTYSPTGTPAPFPTESFGVPIVVLESLVDTEAII